MLRKITSTSLAIACFIIIAVLLVGTGIYKGFNYEVGRVTSCETTVNKYVVAHYSDITMKVNLEGNLVPTEESWNEIVSEKYTATTLNGELTHYSGTNVLPHNISLNKDGYYETNMPPTSSWKINKDKLDHLVYTTTGTLKVRTDKHTFNQTADDSGQCTLSLTSKIKVSTWYTLPLGTDFNI